MARTFSLLIRSIVYFGIIFLPLACSRLEESEKEKIRRLNCKAEAIYRNDTDTFYLLATPQHTPRALYPWEAEAHLPRITKEYFRCKGNPSHPPLKSLEPQNPLTDCEGSSRHGLPILGNKEGVYPILLELLNFIQKKTGKRVIITCGHRCPSHNTYSDPSKENRTSKHQIGAEVDFYVQGMEDRPLEIAGLIMQYYQENDKYQKDKDYEFRHYNIANLAIQPWMNKEIFIKVQQKHEGRDADNRHPYPYLTIQVRHDRDRNERVLYEWRKANLGYPRG